MKLRFIGTRGYHELRTPRHTMHTALLVMYRGGRIMIDCGEDWLGKFEALKPHAMVLTHAHPDHAWGLKDGAFFPIYATGKTWDVAHSEGIAVEQEHVIEERKPFTVRGVAFEAFPLEHSLRCPAVGYRISTARASCFYAPDVVYIPERAAALAGVQLYIGDGATMTQSFVQKRGKTLIGHAPVRTQITWCEKEGVPRAIITHCGKEIVGGYEAAMERQIQEWGQKKDVDASLAFDGLEVKL